ncbi:restriction endonuclease subunit S [Citrobacter freundii]|uniref:restriction endonuclease subunit S n=1 Tax=Citrobacter TaxID=544 RepID=UPI0009C5EE5A|nr:MULTISPECIES: restriction endonuclease subunit S [Citrobacter]MCQ6308356.1 restriction endonuclease subunit S [Citrobacter portucalensis]MDM2791956.1 restriction endonuclease subunit S [Citrobacter sp. Cpo114]OPX50346.1 restriction endonuclease subunit S [Citrobacter portucalensis]UKK34365.1 restriction endonuclease subunit S [Citrobacter freundii]
MAKYKAYPEYKDSGVEWLGEIPSHWHFYTGKRLFSSVRTPALSNDEQLAASQKYGVIPQTLMMQLNDSKVMLALKGTDSFRHVQKNNFVISLRSFEGGIEYSNYQGCVSPAYTVLKNVKKISFSFYSYLLKSALYISALQSSTDSLRDGKSINYDQFGAIILPYPFLQEQSRIAHFLDHEITKIDKLIEKQQQLIELLKEKCQAVISHAVTKGLNPDMPMRDSGIEWLGKVPQHWQCTKIKYIAILTPRKSSIRFKYNDKCTFIPMEKLKRNSLFTDENTLINKVINSYTYFEDNDLLLAKVTPCFENKNIAIADGLTNGIGFGSTEIYVLRTTKKIRADYLLYRLQEDNFMRAATSAMTGAGGLKRVPSEFLLNYPIALPPQSEIDKIVESLSKQESHYNLLELNAMQGIQLLKERRTALISAAVTGKIDVRNWRVPNEQTAGEAEAVV